MPRLIWSRQALRDVTRLHQFLNSENPDAANRAVITIRRGLKLLERHPEAGRPMEEMPPQFREWPIAFGKGGYLALYHYDGETVVVVAVRHDREAGY